MSIRVGEVIAVQGTKVVLKIDEQSSKETLFHGGDKYKGSVYPRVLVDPARVPRHHMHGRG